MGFLKRFFGQNKGDKETGADEPQKVKTDDEMGRMIAACMDHLADEPEEWMTKGTSRIYFDMPGMEFRCFISVEKSLTKEGWRIVPAVVRHGDDRLASVFFNNMNESEMVNALREDRTRREVREDLMDLIQGYDDD